MKDECIVASTVSFSAETTTSQPSGSPSRIPMAPLKSGAVNPAAEYTLRVDLLWRILTDAPVVSHDMRNSPTGGLPSLYETSIFHRGTASHAVVST